MYLFGFSEDSETERYQTKKKLKRKQAIRKFSEKPL